MLSLFSDAVPANKNKPSKISQLFFCLDFKFFSENPDINLTAWSEKIINDLLEFYSEEIWKSMMKEGKLKTGGSAFHSLV